MPDYGIDKHSEYSLYDVLENEYHPWEDDFHFEWYGFHIVPTNADGDYIVQYDGHAGEVMRFSNDDYDDVLGLVSDLNDVLLRSFEYDYTADKKGLVEWAGKIMTSDEERAEENPDLYIHIPDERPEWDEAE